MLIDRVLKEMPTISLMGKLLADAVVFRIHEGIEDYRKDYKKYNFKGRYVGYNLPEDGRGIRMPTFFPYNNIIVQFDDGFDWYVTMDKIKSVGYEDEDIRLVANVFLKNDSEEIHMFKEICQETTNNGYTIERFEPDTFPIMLLSKAGYLMDMGMIHDGEHMLIVHGDMPQSLKDHIQKFAQDTIVSSKKFLEMISCKNIQPSLVEPPPKLQKKRQKSGKLPFKSYYVLKVKPMGKRTVARKSGQGLWDNRVHYCRGHFKVFTDEKPLFGKYSGRYWFNPQVRGSKNAGIIEKDYEL